MKNDKNFQLSTSSLKVPQNYLCLLSSNYFKTFANVKENKIAIARKTILRK